MGLFESLIGGATGAEMVTLVSAVVEKHGGIQGLVSQFEQQGLGGVVQSWVANGENQAISPDQIHQVLGPDTVKQLAEKLGIPADELAAKLAAVLPQAVDNMTPQGAVAA